VAGQPVLLLLPISNPNPVALSNIRAMLMIDGKAVQTQTLAALQPQESRSINFSQVVVAQPGIHEVKIGIQLQKPDSKPQMGMFNQVLVAQPGSLPATGAAVSTKATRPATGSVSSATGTPTVTGAGSSPAVAGAKRAEVTISPADLTFSPLSTIVGRPVEFAITVRNNSEVASKAGALVLKLIADGKLVATTQTPIQFAIAAKGTYQTSWRAVMPAGTVVELMAFVTADGQEVPGKSQATILVKTQVPTAPRTPVSAPVKRIP
jgi:hypothetical protein